MTFLTIIFAAIIFSLACLSIIPALPVVPMQFVVILIFGGITSFSGITGWEILVFGIIASLSLVVDYSAGAVGARIGGAHRWSVLSGIVGGVLGSIFFPPFGAFIGIPAFVMISEFFVKNSPEKLVRTAGYSLLGAVAGVMLNGFLAFLSVVMFLIFVF